ncbi:hypothetical protein HPULCUR_010618 [Helicostylum pulchrum]|uniref:Uracil-DNA glycosylase-like domain-containing protein n=1 Tax=Helicostylum pulchrum TaxID=562976 RepID=A0ABP9YE64_9FUNG
MLNQYCPLTIIESRPVRENTFFAQDKDNFFQYMTNTPTELEEYNIQFGCDYDDECNSLRKIEYRDTQQATSDFRHRITTERPRLVLLVGNYMSQFLYDRDTTPGQKPNIGDSQVYSLPSTSILNTIYSTRRLQDLFDDSAEVYENFTR